MGRFSTRRKIRLGSREKLRSLRCERVPENEKAVENVGRSRRRQLNRCSASVALRPHAAAPSDERSAPVSAKPIETFRFATNRVRWQNIEGVLAVGVAATIAIAVAVILVLQYSRRRTQRLFARDRRG